MANYIHVNFYSKDKELFKEVFPFLEEDREVYSFVTKPYLLKKELNEVVEKTVGHKDSLIEVSGWWEGFGEFRFDIINGVVIETDWTGFYHSEDDCDEYDGQCGAWEKIANVGDYKTTYNAYVAYTKNVKGQSLSYDDFLEELKKGFGKSNCDWIGSVKEKESGIWLYHSRDLIDLQIKAELWTRVADAGDYWTLYNRYVEFEELRACAYDHALQILPYEDFLRELQEGYGNSDCEWISRIELTKDGIWYDSINADCFKKRRYSNFLTSIME